MMCWDSIENRLTYYDAQSLRLGGETWYGDSGTAQLMGRTCSPGLHGKAGFLIRRGRRAGQVRSLSILRSQAVKSR